MWGGYITLRGLKINGPTHKFFQTLTLNTRGPLRNDGISEDSVVYGPLLTHVNGMIVYKGV